MQSPTSCDTLDAPTTILGVPVAEDLETWLLEAGDKIIEANTAPGSKTLSAKDNAIYCMWVLDYAVRNAGSLDPIEDLYPRTLHELTAFARTNRLPLMSQWLTTVLDEEKFCDDYLDHFDAVCGELKQFCEPAAT